MTTVCVIKRWRIVDYWFGVSDSINHFRYLFSTIYVFSLPFVLFSGFVPTPNNQRMTSFDLDASPLNTSTLGSLRTVKLGLSPGWLSLARALRELHWAGWVPPKWRQMLCRSVVKGSMVSTVISKSSSTLNRLRQPIQRHSDVTK